MKRITAIFFLLTFLTANPGMAVNVHYCGGKISSISLFSSHKQSCKCGKKAMKKDCCKDKTTFLKLKDDLLKSDFTSFKISTLKHTLSLPKPFDFLHLAQTQKVGLPFYHPPPFKPKAPIYLLDRVLLI